MSTPPTGTRAGARRKPLTPEHQAQLAEHLRFYRELGIYDLYRRGEAPILSAEEVAELQAEQQAAVLQVAASAEPVKETTPESSPAPALLTIQTEQEEADIAPRKPMPAQPPIADPVPPAQHAAALQLIRDEIGDCQRCTLAAGRNKLVFADGDPNARLMFVGEGPGADEDASGIPFVGRGGQLLNNMIAAMGLTRESVYIANIVKCRPPANRTPEPEEAYTCTPFLFRQIDVVRPEVVVALGATAATYLMGAKSPLGALRGRVHPFRGTKLIVTYHPAFLLRDPRQKGEAWKDLQLAMAELGLEAPKRG